MVMTEAKKQLGRRNFLKAVATLPVAAGVLWKGTSMTPVRAGIVGAGGQGRTLMENSPATHLRYVAVADIDPENRRRGIELARKLHDTNPDGYEDYRRLLERKDLEAVVIAVPLWMHEQAAVDALQAGKHVFCEKSLAKTIEGGRRMVTAAATARRTLQTGHQRAYNPQYQETKRLIEAGTIGEVFHVRAVWHRNGDWRRAVPASGFDPRPWGYPDLEHLKNWRLYEKYSNGLMAELASHQLHAIDWIFERRPHAVLGSGAVYRYKDGREVADHIFLIFEYPGGLTVSYSSIQSNAFDHYYEEFMGTKGTIILTGEKDALLFLESDRTKATTMTVEPVTVAPVLEASESRARDAAGSGADIASQATSSLSAYRLEMEGFAATIRHGAPNRCDGVAGLNAAVAVVKGNEAIASGNRVEIPAAAYWRG